MLLRDFMEKYNLTLAQMSIELGISRSYLHLLVHHERSASKLLIEKIEKYTDGQVTEKDLVIPNEIVHCPLCQKRVGHSKRAEILRIIRKSKEEAC